MCQWCLENPKCTCNTNCEVAITTGHIAGEMRTRCPDCGHTVQRNP